MSEDSKLTEDNKSTEDNTSIEDHKTIARRFRADLWQSGNLSLADQIISRDCRVHSRIPVMIDIASGPEAIKQLLFFYHLVFSEITMKIEDVVAENDLVAVRWSGSGRHTGELFGVAATDRVVETSGIDMLRIVDGKIVEGWINWDALSFLESLVGGSDESGSDFLGFISRLQGAAGS